MIKLNQHSQIHAWLKAHKRPMTPMDAFRLNPPCTKLATRIGEMIDAGYNIGKVWIDTKEKKKACRGYFLK